MWSLPPQPSEGEWFLPDGSEPVLQDFCALLAAGPSEIEKFAGYYGVLYICERDRPMTHTWGAGRASPEELRVPSFKHCFPRPVDDQGLTYWEPLRVWRHLAREAGAIVSLTDALHAGRGGVSADWAAIIGPESPPKSPVDKRTILAQRVTQWMRDSGISYALHWGRGGPILTVSGGSLFGYLASQLLVRVSGAPGFVICAECGQPFTPPRRGRTGVRHFCPDCGKRAKDRQAARDYRARKLARTA